MGGDCFTKDPDGFQHRCCDEKNHDVCPTAKQLEGLAQVRIYAEGVEGDFQLDVQEVKATDDKHSQRQAQDLKNVITADNVASNGVVHIIDGVLIPPATPNIVRLAESVKDLSTLVAAVVAGGLADTLSSPGPFTVFAPTNEAFAALPAGVLSKLMKPENKKELIDILTYHVLPKKVLSKDLKNVVKADNLASNGVVHIIDGVLLPPSGAIVGVSSAVGVELPACPKAIFEGFC